MQQFEFFDRTLVDENVFFHDLGSTARADGIDKALEVVCSEIIRRLGSRIEVESSAGKGSTFRFRILAQGCPGSSLSLVLISIEVRSRTPRLLAARLEKALPFRRTGFPHARGSDPSLCGFNKIVAEW